jgi:transcriptional regulator with XRE-family HTH domain
MPQYVGYISNIVSYLIIQDDGGAVISAAQLRAARALLGVDQRRLAELSGLSVPTIQRMEASDGTIRGNVDSLMKLIAALDAAGLEVIGEGAASQASGRGVRLKAATRPAHVNPGEASKTAAAGSTARRP